MLNFGDVQTGRRCTDSGKSHSWERPTRWSSTPRAQTISVALAIRETIRGMTASSALLLARCLRHWRVLWRCRPFGEAVHEPATKDLGFRGLVGPARAV